MASNRDRRLEEENAALKKKNEELQKLVDETKKKMGNFNTRGVRNVFKVPKMLNIPEARSLLIPSGIPGRINAEVFTQYLQSEETGLRSQIVDKVSVDEKTGAITGLSEILSTKLQDSRERESKSGSGCSSIQEQVLETERNR